MTRPDIVALAERLTKAESARRDAASRLADAERTARAAYADLMRAAEGFRGDGGSEVVARRERGAAQADVLRALADGPLTNRELAERAGMPDAQAYLTSTRLQAKHKVTRDDDGRWRLIEVTP